MKVIGVIPARYNSSRFPGKPLADICGKPMVWWVYQQAKKVKELDEVYVATDDDRIKDVCHSFGIKVVMTSTECTTHINRLKEFSDQVPADLYVCICGDEPSISHTVISSVIPPSIDMNNLFVGALRRAFTNPVEVIDPSNIKISTNEHGECIYLSRSPIPYPYKTINFTYYKIVGVECYNKQALDYFDSKEAGYLERIEDITLLRFIENRIPITFTLVETDSLSVDTPKDLEKVREIIGLQMQQKNHEL
ncbi:3-deoxy-manno-octulosonate cytidylyltransferase [Paenibacillus sp. 32352]|uniref:3-deoxy-manno-octulosonate cytidylyltransferase n=1 Tax=Paenibacillus sp. 32352 TaxID=1969111 RepID=UPI0009AEDDD8|nr:3-deoxy-manno-octulosonate cytidylyltransferase [Paenibacillus sp. 32352]